MRRTRVAAWIAPTALATVCVAAVLASAADSSADLHSDTQLHAMSDELARSRTLKLNDLDKPYFIEYTVSDAVQRFIAASFGGLTQSSGVHFRQPRLFIRVGDYKFDNTNSIYSGVERFGFSPLDDDYQAMRMQLWLSTDALYKASAEQIAHKRAALREIQDPDDTPDFAPAKAVQIIRPVAVLDFDQNHWEQLVRRLSARFGGYSDVITSDVVVRAISSTYRLVNTEGAILRVPQEFSQLEIRSSGLTAAGNRVWNHSFIAVLKPSQFPAEKELATMADSVASQTAALVKAPLAEDYTGPVLFEQEAAAEMMAQVLTDAIRLQRKPLAPPGSNDSGLQPLDSVWSSRIGAKVAPDWLNLFDDPRQQQFHGTPLAGYYEVDDQGVPSERVSIIEKGTFKNFLLSREPVRTFKASNGHGRLPGSYGSEQAEIGNLFVQPEQTLSEEQLKARLLTMAKTAGLKYAIVIRRIDFPSTANFEQLQAIARQMQKNGYARTLNVPLLAYRVYLDGHEELIRGLRFREFSAKDIRDLEAASDRPYVLNYMNNGSSFNLADYGSDATSSSVVCPSLLFGNLDLTRAEEESSRPPIVPVPAFSAP